MEALLVGFHVAMGAAVVLLGLAALLLPKGSPLHRLAGTVFLGAMIGLSGSGAIIAVFRPDVRGTAVLGMLTLYMTVTGWRTGRRRDGDAGAFEAGAAAFAILIAIAAVAAGWLGMTHPIGVKDKMFAPVAFVVAALALYFAVLDIRVYLKGGLSGPRRIARHAGRMGFATFLAAAAGLIGQNLRFPEILRPFLFALVLVIFALAVFWLVRVRFTRWRGLDRFLR